MKTLGEKLSSARKSCKMTQEQLAQRINVTRSTISNWELIVRSRITSCCAGFRMHLRAIYLQMTRICRPMQCKRRANRPVFTSFAVQMHVKSLQKPCNCMYPASIHREMTLNSGLMRYFRRKMQKNSQQSMTHRARQTGFFDFTNNIL